MARIMGTAIWVSLRSWGSSMRTGPVAPSVADWLRRSTRKKISLHQITFLAGSKEGSCIDGVAPVRTWIVGSGAVRDALVGDGLRAF
jgi:hypothetical protein